MAEKTFTYDGVVNGVKTKSWTVSIVEMTDPDTGKKKQVPDTHECEEWWKNTYTTENGAFWYKVS